MSWNSCTLAYLTIPEKMKVVLVGEATGMCYQFY